MCYRCHCWTVNISSWGQRFRQARHGATNVPHAAAASRRAGSARNVKAVSPHSRPAVPSATDNPVQGAPTAAAIREMTPERIYDSLVDRAP